MHRARRPRSRTGLWTVAAAVVLAVLVAWGLLVTRQASDTANASSSVTGEQAYFPAPSYTLTDQHGRPFSSSALHGTVQVVSFLFPYCTSYCPIIGATMHQTEQLANHSDLAGHVSFVGFNVDPGGAGPRQMTQFMSEYGINPADPAWHYLTGTAAQIRSVVTDGYHVYYKKVTLTQEQQTITEQKAAGTYTPQPDAPNPLASQANVNYDITHNETVFVVSPSGQVRALFDSGQNATAAQIMAAVRKAATS